MVARWLSRKRKTPVLRPGASVWVTSDTSFSGWGGSFMGQDGCLVKTAGQWSESENVLSN